MNRETWQRLLSLESQDITQQRFQKIHSRELSARRAREINAAAKQAREYFRNADNSDHSVRPLLTFYGVTCLSRALLLLLKTGGGEEGLNAGHGIETVGWGDVMSGDTAAALMQLNTLRIRKRSGLLSDFVKYTENRMAIHIRSGGVDWRCSYDVPERDEELSVADLFSRIPDLQKDYSDVSNELRYTAVNELTYNSDSDLRMTVNKEPFLRFRAVYEELGYATTDEGSQCIVTCKAETLEKAPPAIRSYIRTQDVRIDSGPIRCRTILQRYALFPTLYYVLGVVYPGNARPVLPDALDRTHPRQQRGLFVANDESRTASR